MRGSAALAEARAAIVVRQDGEWTVVEAHGDWTVDTIGSVESAVRKLEDSADPSKVVIDFDSLERIDTAGAFMLGRLTSRCSDPDGDFHYRGEHRIARRLIEEIRRRSLACEPDEVAGFGLMRAMARIGAGLEAAYLEGVDTLAFFGRTLTTAASTLVRPWRFRLTSTVWVMEEAGVNALPIVSVLSFFIGAVVAYMGANLLAQFGASVFTVELVGLAVLREFGVLITAIMLAGRSDSAFTAAIGSMKMQQEIDAMRVLGLDPFEALVLPRVVACVLMAPLLAFAATMAGVFGGMVVSWSVLDIPPSFFLARLQDAVGIQHFWVGMSKAPVFGLIIAVIGCRQGMQVGGDVESLGRRTTASVVQSIFMVIVADALFAMMYLELDI